MKIKASFFTTAILNSYAILFFSQNKILGVVLLAVSFFDPLAGISGFLCVLFSLAVCTNMGYRRESISAGIFSFNNLLLGLAFGSFYSFNLHYLTWLIFGSLLVTMITIVLAERLSRFGLPILSFPFIICFWIIVLAANSAFNTGLQLKNNYLEHDVLVDTFPGYISLFFRSVSAVIFQNNIVCGILITAGLFVHSRIAFTLFVISFLTACGFNGLTHIFPAGISYYDLGVNFMLTSVAAGSFLTIPSARSYLWALLCIPVVFIFISAFTGLLALHGLPVLSLPFSVIIVTLLYFLLLRKNSGSLQLVKLQHYSPERNLYQFINQENRLDDVKYFPFQLPFMGSWTVSQGYDGKITHKNDWGKALDFVIENEENNTFRLPGNLTEHFYCFNKPVLACADGVVVTVVDHIDDNAIGETNLADNWGNTVVIQHLGGLYSKVSHLKKGSVKVKQGDMVKQGEVIGRSGNSGRSPEPHLHFQVQTTPYIDAKTLAYPFACYLEGSKNGETLVTYETPGEGELISPAVAENSIRKAFDFLPGYCATLKAANSKEETIEAYMDDWGQSYLYSKETGASAYFINNGNLIYFTSFYGDDRSLLYYFFLAAFKIVFTNSPHIKAADHYPLQLTSNILMRWLQDMVSPFYRFVSLEYQSSYYKKKTGAAIRSSQTEKVFGQQKIVMEAEIAILNNCIKDFTVKLNGKDHLIEWQKQSTY